QVPKNEQEKILDILPDYLPQMWYVPVLFTSATTSIGMDLLLKFAQEALGASDKQIEQEELDAFLQKVMTENMPGKIDDERAPKIFSITQISKRPPSFRIMVNFP